ncbi:YidC/Oxa1 family membrane protein insertase [Paenibacillus sp. UMB4589-SE434]|uniref:YidC/Oxa1 family membrane protein insertase n=1 Tax=Paenibacillus sp. UMB4589-SE434 TaxID=3046314 RepID=UPI00254B1695|nr:YidC/Oxa1 family membrane protein insertase [Paenibacillus sp. UMB4589-SE434]MDK8179305.1 YidC/Oxa1 family membrane protein insertase [Paenibacillus sp. UMB4589-SE434]
MQWITDGLNSALNYFYYATGDWGLAVIALTLLVRVALIYVNFYNAKGQVKQISMREALKGLQAKFEHNKEKLLEESTKLYRQYGIGLTMLLPLIQMPLFIGLYRMFTAHGGAMSSTFIPWVSSFGQSDPYHVMPILYALLSFVAMMIPVVPELAVAGSMLKRMGLPFIFTAIMLMVFWQAPVALGLYWAVNAMFTLIERLIYRTPIGQRLLRKGVPGTA